MAAISIIVLNDQEHLETDNTDRIRTGSKILAQLFPDGILHNIVASVIPNQKTERLVDFAKILHHNLNALEGKFDEQKLRTGEFADLLEDTLVKASRVLTPVRFIDVQLSNLLVRVLPRRPISSGLRRSPECSRQISQ